MVVAATVASLKFTGDSFARWGFTGEGRYGTLLTVAAMRPRQQKIVKFIYSIGIQCPYTR